MRSAQVMPSQTARGGAAFGAGGGSTVGGGVGVRSCFGACFGGGDGVALLLGWRSGDPTGAPFAPFPEDFPFWGLAAWVLSLTTAWFKDFHAFSGALAGAWLMTTF